MRFPLEVADIDAVVGGFAGDFCRCISVKRSMRAVIVVILAEIRQLSLQIAGIPEEYMVKVFAANSTDQSFDERVR